MNNSLSITKIISGLSKTLNIANKLIPLYQEVKPYLNKTNNLINNIPNIFPKPISKPIKPPTENINTNLPTFFQ